MRDWEQSKYFIYYLRYPTPYPKDDREKIFLQFERLALEWGGTKPDDFQRPQRELSAADDLSDSEDKN